MDPELTLEEKKRARFETTIDILYLVSLFALYLGSFLNPVFGIIIGIILKTASLSERAKKIGKVCLILGIIGLGILVLIIIIALVVWAMMSSSGF